MNLIRFGVVVACCGLAVFGQAPLVKIDPAVRQAAQSKAQIPVLLVLRYQPEREIQELRKANELEMRSASERYARSAVSEKARARRERDQAIIASRQRMNSAIRSLVAPSQRAVTERISRLGASLVRSFWAMNMLAAQIPAAALPQLETDPDVAEVLLDETHEAHLDVSVPALGGPAFWRNHFRGEGESVVVLDSGVATSHPAFNGVQMVSRVFNDSKPQSSACFDDDANSVQDMTGHGTHVAGIIASQGTSAYPSFLGVAPGIDTLYNLKIGFHQKTIQGQCSGGASAATSDTLSAIQWALDNTPARIVNYSYGRSYAKGGTETPDDDSIARLFDQIADQHGLILVVSAGNDGEFGRNSLGSPGIAYNIISVASMNDAKTATRSDDTISSFSSRGPTLLGRSKPDIAGPGQTIYSASYLTTGMLAMSGTSMAAPHIAGAAALVHGAGVSDPLAVKAVLINTADGTGWRPDVAWGYSNLTTAYAQLSNYLSVSDPAPVQFYAVSTKQAYKATVAWNRHINGNAATSGFKLNDISAYLYSRGNNTMLSRADATGDNVKQVSTSQAGELVVKVNDSAAEPYAIASSVALQPVTPPSLTLNCTVPASVAARATFQMSCTAFNRGGVEAFSALGTPGFPSGFSSTDSPMTFGTLVPGSQTTRVISVVAPATTGTYPVPVRLATTAFGEAFNASTTVTVSVGAGGGGNTPTLTLNRQSLAFSYTTGGTAPASQTISVGSSGSALTLSVTADSTWLSAVLSVSSTPAVLTVSAKTTGLGIGTYNGSVRVAAAGASNTPQVIPVTLTITGSNNVTLDTKLMTSAVSSGTGCTQPAPKSRFYPSDDQALVWFLVRGASAGDRATLEWYGPDQVLYQSGTWTPVASNGNWCFWAGIDVAGKPPASKPGTWTVRVAWNGRALFSQTFDVVQPVTLRTSMTTAAIPSGSGCPAPQAQSEFLTTDSRVYLWSLVDNATSGDLPKMQWFQPDGTLYKTSTFSGLSSGGSWCVYASIDIAGGAPANTIGTWTAKLLWNDGPVLARSFTISPPVVLETALISKIRPDGGSCVEPPASNTFLPTDSSAVLWFLVSKAKAGDQITASWYAPGGALYTTTTWDPPSEDGSWCFWAWNDIDGQDAAYLVGTWSVSVQWNGSPLFTRTFNLVPVEVTASMMTKTVPAGSGCVTPSPSSTFAATDDRANIWFLVRNAPAGDQPSVDFIDPSGNVFSHAEWNPVPTTGDRCFWAWISIANTSAAKIFGRWTVKTYWNGSPLLSAPFTIGATDPGTPTSLTTMAADDVAKIETGTDQDAGAAADVVRPRRTRRLLTGGRTNGQAQSKQR